MRAEVLIRRGKAQTSSNERYLQRAAESAPKNIAIYTSGTIYQKSGKLDPPGSDRDIGKLWNFFSCLFLLNFSLCGLYEFSGGEKIITR